MRGGEAVHVFQREYEARFGIVPVIAVADAVQLNKALKIAGESYPELVEAFLKREDPFLEKHGYSGRFLTAAVINAWKLAEAKKKVPVARPAEKDYKSALDKWRKENGLSELSGLVPLPNARGDA